MANSNDLKVFTAQYAEDGGWRNWAYSPATARLVPGPVHADAMEAKDSLKDEEGQLRQLASAG